VIEKMKNMIVGLFVMVAAGLIVGIILFIQPGTGDGGQTLNVRFSNINGIGVGTRVLFAGKAIGEVVAIETIPNARNQPVDQLGQMFYYQLVLKIDSKAKIYTTDEITLATSGLLGEKSISIIPKRAPKGVVPQLVTAKTPLYADSVDPFQEAFHEISLLADAMQHTFEKVNVWIDDNGHALGDAIRSFESVMDEGTKMLTDVNDLHLVQDVKAAVNTVTDTFGEAGDVIKQMRQDEVFDNLGIVIDKFRTVTDNLEIVTDKVAGGEGTIGRLFMSDDFYLEINAVISKVETLMNDVNNYGILFNNNKEWQRLRSKRATLLNALDTPEKFKSYFEDEVDNINTSMARISMLIKRAESTPQKERILESSLFHKDFADLLRLVNQLLDNLKLYNEQLEDARLEMCP
jgi:phospholipid/cholesterol/gamma-HCH transport system substrate-binding protein